MEIKRIAHLGEQLDQDLDPILDNTLDDNELEEIEEYSEDIAEVEEDEYSLEDISMSYVDPKTGLNKLDNSPTEIKANDGMDMLSGTIKVEGFNSDSLSDSVYKGALKDMILEFINADLRIRIDEDSLVTKDLKDGIVSFLVAPAFKLSSRKDELVKEANIQESQKKINKAYNSFFKDLGDLDKLDINKVNHQLYDLIEKVSFLSNVEKLKLRNRIRKKLKENGITLAYIEVNR
jgi:hypothetical protein